MKRTSTSTSTDDVRVKKRSRTVFPETVDDTNLIAPYAHFHGKVDPQLIPSVGVQNLIYEHFTKCDRLYGPGAHIKAKLRAEAGHPFFTHRCKTCDKTLHTCYFTTSGGKNWVKNCSICRNALDKARYFKEYTDGEKMEIRSTVRAMMDEITCPLFNNVKFGLMLDRVLETGQKQLIDLILSKGASFQHVCTVCNSGKFLYELLLEKKSKRGYRDKCMTCTVDSRNVINRKAIGMGKRFGDKDVHGVFERACESQKNLDYYTFMPLDNTPGSPWMASPERLDRNSTYVDGNVVACCDQFNVGGRLNFSHKLVLQFYYSAQLPPVHQFPLSRDEVRWFTRHYNSAKHRSAKRNKKTKRDDRSGEFTIDMNYMVNLAAAQGFRCAVSGIPLVFAPLHPWSGSLDRINSYLGYTPGNVRWVVARFNPRVAWTDTMVRQVRSTLDQTIHKVWDAHGETYDQHHHKHLLENLQERHPAF